jgi:hypothetical protein
MSRTTQSFLVAVAAVITVFSVQTVWRHYHPPDAPRANQRPHKPLPTQEAAEATQAATDFFNAMKNEDWAAVAKSWPPDAPKGRQFEDIFNARVKDAVGGLQIVSMGAPYKEGGNSWVMIPYEVRFKSGDTQTNSLRMMKYPTGQWVWGGGF